MIRLRINRKLETYDLQQLVTRIAAGTLTEPKSEVLLTKSQLKRIDQLGKKLPSTLPHPIPDVKIPDAFDIPDGDAFEMLDIPDGDAFEIPDKSAVELPGFSCPTVQIPNPNLTADEYLASLWAVLNDGPNAKTQV